MTVIYIAEIFLTATFLKDKWPRENPFKSVKSEVILSFVKCWGGGGGGGYARIYANKMETLSGLENFLHLNFDIFRVKLPYVLLCCLFITSNLKLLRAS